MNYRYITRTGIIGIIISVIIIISSVIYELNILLFLGIIVMVVSVLFAILGSTLEVFSKAKVLDIEELEKQGLTIVQCDNCGKNNVKEDIYCVYCGDKLE